MTVCPKVCAPLNMTPICVVFSPLQTVSIIIGNCLKMSSYAVALWFLPYMESIELHMMWRWGLERKFSSGPSPSPTEYLWDELDSKLPHTTSVSGSHYCLLLKLSERRSSQTMIQKPSQKRKEERSCREIWNVIFTRCMGCAYFCLCSERGFNNVLLRFTGDKTIQWRSREEGWRVH